MLWLTLTLLCITVWGVTDVLYKKSLPQNDPLAHFKSLIWNGIIMATAGCVMVFFSDTFTDSLGALPDNLYLIPVAFLYPMALFFGLKGKQELDISIVSPLENIDGAMAAIILYIYFLFQGNTAITNNVSAINLCGTILIVLGVVALGVQEHRLSKQEQSLAESEKSTDWAQLHYYSLSFTTS